MLSNTTTQLLRGENRHTTFYCHVVIEHGAARALEPNSEVIVVSAPPQINIVHLGYLLTLLWRHLVQP